MGNGDIRHQQRLADLEDNLTPAEIAKLISDRRYEQFCFAIRPLLQNGQSPVRYVRESWCENANFYTANRGARRLIVAFCGLANRIGVPTSYFLQMLRDDLYDVLLLSDPLLLHFDRGVPDFSNSLVETTRRVQDFAAAKGYEEIVSFGASMGGFPALRAGLLLSAGRAISVGGRYCWHVRRLMSDEEQIKAFDLLCPCFAGAEVKMTAVLAAKNQHDVRSLDAMRRTFPACRAVMIDTDMHNVTGYFYHLGLLRLFYAALFEYGERPASGLELLSLLNEVARPIHALELQQIARVRQLEHAVQESQQAARAVYASKSWRFTKPLRRFRQLFGRIGGG
jgi:hypothetical protein